MTPEEYFQNAIKFHQAGRLGEAAAMYDELLKHFPSHADCLNLRGSIALQQGHQDAALQLFEWAIAAAPQYAGAHANRGQALHRMGRVEPALQSYTRALELAPHEIQPRIARASLLLDFGRHQEAVADCDALMTQGVSSDQVLTMRARALRALGRKAEALNDLERAYTTAPETELLAGDIAFLSLQLGDWKNFDAKVARVKSGIERGHFSTEPLVATYLPLSAAHQRDAASIFARRHGLARQSQLETKRPRGEPLRIGYFSSDFFDHVSSHLMIKMLEAHDRRNVETIAFAFGGKADAFREMVAKSVNTFIDVASLPDDQIVALARSKSLHIAVDINGYAGGSRPKVFSQGVAPIQVNYLGYPGTLGSSCHDYIIGDSDVTPLADAHDFTESIVTMPHSYQPNSTIKLSALAPPPRRQELGLPEHGFVFCCFNAPHKVTPDVFDVWMRVLSAVDASVLWLLESDPAFAVNIKAEAALRGVAPERIVFSPRVPIGQYLSRYAYADAFLDTFHYNAHTTGGDALLMGVPLVTRRGTTFAGRVGASLLSAAGLPELIAETVEDYEALALRLARDTEFHAAIHDRLKTKVRSSPLFLPQQYARDLEAAYGAMWDRYEHGLAPAHIQARENKH